MSNPVMSSAALLPMSGSATIPTKQLLIALPSALMFSTSYTMKWMSELLA
ncbi:MAG: hypothetical protein BWY06_02542 [Candidatus Latescibacteria bacterium ADurb.Bin168]|nr:MAG: hypothetical protein BWY06_02542 [Candidatus Latescibacteria bacterium ADurb.Bin168]